MAKTIEEIAAYKKAWYRERADRIKADRKTKYHELSLEERSKNSRRDFIRKYGITIEIYETMLAGQGGVCRICKRPPGSKRLGVDHNHATGKVRGVLCQKCNTAIGLADDNADRLRAMASYLDEARLS